MPSTSFSIQSPIPAFARKWRSRLRPARAPLSLLFSVVDSRSGKIARSPPKPRLSDLTLQRLGLHLEGPRVQKPIEHITQELRDVIVIAIARQRPAKGY